MAVIQVIRRAGLLLFLILPHTHEYILYCCGVTTRTVRSLAIRVTLAVALVVVGVGP